MKHAIRLLLSSVFLLLLTLGCSKSTPPSPGAGTAEARQPQTSASTGSGGPAAGAPAAPTKGAAKALTIAYSDWPGWVAWEIAIQKGWFKEAGVEVEFKWFEYVPSMEAYSAGKVDAVTVTNGDMLVTGATGKPSVAILINDYSNGNDMVVAAPGITDVAALKGKKVGVEVGFVSHLLLMNALKSAGLTDKDIEITNVPTDQTPQTLKSGAVDAIVAWQPNSGQALKEVPGSKAIYTSANVKGIIYDLLCVDPKSLAERRGDWQKVTEVWFRVAEFVRDPKNAAEAAKLMATRVGLKPEEYLELMKGTYIMSLAENVEAFKPATGLGSLLGSSQIVDEFNVANDVYKKPMPVAQYLDASFVTALAGAKK